MRVYKFNHGNPSLFFEEISKKYQGAKYEDGHLFKVSDDEQFDIRHFKHIPGMEVSVVNARMNETVLVEDPIEGDDVLVVRFMIDSFVGFQSDNPKGMEIERVEGCCMYNTKFPFKLIIPKQQEVKFITIRLKLDILAEIENINWFSTEHAFFDSRPWAMYETLSPAMENCVKNIFAAQKNPEGRMGFTYSEGLKLMTLFFIKITKDREPQEKFMNLTVNPETLIQIKNELCKDLEHPVSVSELASQFGMSAQKLRVNFKRFFGKSANQLLQQVRYEEAERKLLFSDESVQSIAISLGFNSAAHFTSEFKKRYKKSPLEYRKGE